MTFRALSSKSPSPLLGFCAAAGADSVVAAGGAFFACVAASLRQ